ncbi:MAG TPA: hypothetical protein VJK26_02600 [Patescibacteria group bacterium]|nr:hypothetical protein [Patescibacteria group bacterium]
MSKKIKERTMSKRKTIDSKRARDHDQKLQKPNSYLETQKSHKEWYNISEMGKQRGKPRAVPRNLKKPGGVKKHSLRKEK